MNEDPRARRQGRVDRANELIAVIASCGRRFFSHGDRVARLELDHRGRVWWIDHYTQRRVYTHYRGEWRGFTSGGTLRNLVERLRDYISAGKRLHPAQLGPWPAWVCDGDLWAYGDDMEIVRSAARRLGIIATPLPTLRVLVLAPPGRGTTRWVAQGVDLDLATSADDRTALIGAVVSQLRGQVELDRQRGRPAFSKNRTAPEIFAQRYAQALPIGSFVLVFDSIDVGVELREFSRR